MATTSKPIPFGNRTEKSTTHSKEAALSEREFERYYRGTHKIPYETDRRIHLPEVRFCILALGRLGLRAGELRHLSREWIDTSEKTITIPRQDICQNGTDGEQCGTCHQAARQIADHNPEYSVQDALDYRWHPKTEAGAREIYYGFSPRIEIVVREFVGNYRSWPTSQSGITRRVERVAELSDAIDPNEIRPHALRATAASYIAGRGMSIQGLLQMFGWSDHRVGVKYITRSARNTKRMLSQIHQG